MGLPTRHRRHFVARLFTFTALWWLQTGASMARDLTFERDIRPLLKVHCLDCHGAGELSGELDLRLRRFMVAGGESGAAIVAGDPQASLIVERLRRGEMPPGEVKMPAADIETIESWIASGAKTLRPEPESIAPGIGITAEEREFWSFQPIRRPPIPDVDDASRVRTPIDAFLLHRMAPLGLSFAPDADRLTLIRRAYLDLLGLPPPRESVETFLGDRAPGAWERLVDRLLQSPHYGERWARHWLDVAGYADSEGDAHNDTVRAFAYKYRDYVIRAFNADKPFDRFLQEQLAGDELVTPPYKDLSAQSLELLTATGFLRMAADPTASGGGDAEKNQVVADTLKIVSTSVLGLSVGCAQCHDHRYDPIPQRDYYALRALLEPALDWKSWRHSTWRISLYTDEERAQAAAIEAQVAKVAQERAAKQADYIKAALDKELTHFPEAVREPLRAAYYTAADKRTEEQIGLLNAYPSSKITGGNLYQYNAKAAEDLKKYNAKMNKLREKKPFEDFLRVLTEIPGQVPKTYLFHRGDHNQPKQEVGPGVLTIAAGETLPDIPADAPDMLTTGRRLHYARWLTSGDHPLVTRVFVNRVWMHHFGYGIVSTPSDFGRLGTKPTHPDLLDWLAREFVARGWSLKALHRLIMTSTAYRQSSRRNPNSRDLDPDGRLYSRKPVIRLEAEVLRDRMLVATGELNTEMFGPALAIQDHFTGQVVASSTRRSLYIQVRRTKPVAMLKVFDAPVMETNCDRRSSSTVAPQALLLMNSDFILERARAFAQRVQADAAPATENLATATSTALAAGQTNGSDSDALRRQLKLAWELAYCREATDDELDLAAAFVSRQRRELRARERALSAQDKEKSATAKSGKKKKETQPRLDPETQALANLCQVLLGSNEFLYVD